MAPRNYKILVLPSGAATGIISSTILTQLEHDTGAPIYQHFDEIWCSSIGSMIAALLTTPKKSAGLSAPVPAPIPASVPVPPMSAAEVTVFLERSFSNLAQAVGIRGKFKKQLPLSTLMRDTLIPLRILSAEVTRFNWIWPLETQLKSFSSAEDGGLSLASVVSSSCTVFPFHPFAEPVCDSDGRVRYCIDAGCEVCTESCMNPLTHLFQEFSKNIDPSQDSVAIYFISNGWVRMDNSWGSSGMVKMPRADGIDIADGIDVNVKVFNIDVSLSSVIRKWQKDTRVGSLLNRVKNEYLFYNLAGGGVIHTAFLKAEALKISKQSESYKVMLESLQGKAKKGSTGNK